MNAQLAYANALALPRSPIKEARQSLGILTARENHHTPESRGTETSESRQSTRAANTPFYSRPHFGTGGIPARFVRRTNRSVCGASGESRRA